MKENADSDGLNLKKIYTISSNYKWLILSMMLLSMLLMFIYLYVTPSIYRSSTMLEVKVKTKPTTEDETLVGALSFDERGKVGKDVEVLKTFLVNEKAIAKLNLQVAYFLEDGYKDSEIYDNVPIDVSVIEIRDKDILNKKIILTPNGNRFKLGVEYTFLDYLKIWFLNEKHINFEDGKWYEFNKKINNKYFTIEIDKILDLNKNIKFSILGERRQVYSHIVKNNLDIQQLGERIPLIKISYEDTIPKRATDYISALTSTFIDETISSKNEQNDKILLFIEHQLSNIKSKLTQSENQLESYKNTNDIIEPSVQAKKYIEKLSELEIELSENQLKDKLVTNLIKFIKSNDNLDAIAPSLIELKDKPTLDLISSYQALELKENNLRAELTDEHPELITLKRQMFYLRKKIVSNIRNLKRLLEKKEHTLKEEKKKYEEKIKKLPLDEKKLVDINRNYKVSSKMYDYLLKKRTESELLIVSTLSEYKIIDIAHTDEEPIRPKRTFLILVSPFIGLLFGIFIAIVLKRLSNKISNKEELEALTDLPLLGIIPLYKDQETKLEVYKDPNSEFTESYRSLRTNLPSKKENGQANVIVVTSTNENEGKTTLIANLAGVCQMAGYKSIILNLDLRKPSLHEYFNLKNKKGMSSYLSGKESLSNIIFSTAYPDLHIITSGPIPSNPSELILSDKFASLIDILKNHYDYIFIDTAPVGLVSDTIALMKNADLNLIIFKENYAEASYVDAIHNIIKKSNIKNVGIVLNQSKSKNKSNGYGYGYGYGYGID
jgi:capsular exopolysaccharide synthesis family protein